MLQEFCPDCGTRRVALFRWCRKCGLDYDELDSRGDLPRGPYATRIAAGATGTGATSVAPPTSARPAPAITSVTIPAAIARMATLPTHEPADDQAPTTTGGRLLSVASAPDMSGSAMGASRGAPMQPVSGGISVLRRRSSRRPISRSLAFALAAVMAIGLLGGAYAADLGGVQTAVATFAAGPAAAPAAAPVPSSDPTPTPVPSFTPSGPTTEATVERVVDGDTIVVDADGVELYIRYLGMDAPEAVKLDTPVQFMAPEATQANAQLVSGQIVILERDVSESDDSARLLRHVWVDRDGTLFLVGLELVKAGFALATPLPPDTRYDVLYGDAEAQARAGGLGIWGAPPSPGPEATLPPTPAPAPVRLTTNDPVTITDGIRSDFHGAAGSYTWRAVNLTVPAVKVAWTVDASPSAGCTFDWTLTPASAAPVGGRVDVPRKGHKIGKANHETPFRRAMLTATSTCPSWRLSVTGVGS